jgi:hypothetical protein
MPRYRQEPDDEIIEDGDAGFVGVNALLEPGLLRTAYQYNRTNDELIGPGLCSDARNKRFLRGHAETRPGVCTPVQFNPDGGWDTIYGTGVFSDPNGYEWILLATADGVYRIRDGLPPTSLITLADGAVIDGPCELVQAFDQVILFRGPDLEPLVWNGFESSYFLTVIDPISVDYLDRIPSADFGVVMSGRMWVPVGRDQIAVSDLLDYTSWDAAMNTLRINAGEDDALVGLQPFRATSMLVFKERSIFRILNATGDLADLAVETVNSNIGCAARRTVAIVGGDVFFLSRSGVMRITEVVQDSMQALEVPISEPIRPWIERINWEYAHLSSARAHDRYYFLAVPMDGQTKPQTLLVYDTTTRQWQGMDTFPADLSLDRLHVSRWMGQRSLISIDLDVGRVALHGVGRSDEIEGTAYYIPDMVQTRGFVGQTNAAKRWRHADLEVSTWDPNFTISVVVPGVSEQRELRTVTRDRTRYMTHGRGVHDVTNGAIHAAQDRQDYKIMSDDGVDSNVGVMPELEQVFRLGLQLRETARWCALRIENTQGTCAVRFCRLDGRAIQNQGRVQQ